MAKSKQAFEKKMAAVDAKITSLYEQLEQTTDEAEKNRIADELLHLAFNPEGLKYKLVDGVYQIDEDEDENA